MLTLPSNGKGSKIEEVSLGTLFLSLAEKLVRHPKRIVFPEGTNPQVVRAAARFAVTKYLGYGPQWDAPYRFTWISGPAVAEEITACLTAK
jgi:hypothetical protein